VVDIEDHSIGGVTRSSGLQERLLLNDHCLDLLHPALNYRVQQRQRLAGTEIDPNPDERTKADGWHCPRRSGPYLAEVNAGFGRLSK
jgi:hypothetical protein